MNDITRNYPEFKKIVDLISTQNPLQRKRINNFICSQDIDYWEYAEKICKTLNQTFLRSEKEQIEAARSYNRMSMDFLREQIRFRKTGVYSVSEADSANKNVYSQPEVMRYYMVGLFLSYMLWPNHFQILRFFKNHIRRISKINRYLDIAPGHGLFAMEVMQRFPELKAMLLDISATSISVTSDILAAFNVNSSRFHFINDDFLFAPVENESFDFISMGEVLEHVDDASGFLEKAHCLLRPEGTIFMSTCSNCPAIDHVYHFHSINEIRCMIYESGFSILEDKSLPAEQIPEEEWQKELVTVNYCAILNKASK